MIETLAGNNDFEVAQALKAKVAEFVSKHTDLALERLESEELDLQTILEAVQNPPFLSQRKLVVIYDLSKNKNAVEHIEQIISSTSENVDVIFYEPHLDKRTVYFKVLKDSTHFKEFGEKEPQSLAKWLVEEAKSQGSELAHSDANFLVERLGTDQALLFSELNKLITYNSKISRQNIELLVEPNPQSRVFDLLDATFRGKKTLALKLYDEQRAQKVEPQAILALIAWQLQLVALMNHAGKEYAKVASDTGGSTYPLMKAATLAKEIDKQKLKRLVNEAYAIDVASKSEAIELDEAIKTYIATF